MNAQLKKADMKAVSDPTIAEPRHRPQQVLDQADCPMIEHDKSSGRRLRTLILVGNAVAWILIIVMIRAIFF
jgi:hypothetical protein